MSELDQTEEVCKYNQNGFCKFGEKCRKRHESETCKYKNQCHHKECTKRHPKMCRNFVKYGNCRWNSDCAYKHETKRIPTHVEELEKEIEHMKKEINLLRENMIEIMKHLDSVEPRTAVQHQEVNENQLRCNKCDCMCKKEITLQKHTHTNHACAGEEAENQQCKEKEIIKDVSVEEDMNKLWHNSLKLKVNDFPTSDANKSKASVEGLRSCDFCDYKCKRVATLEKHKNTKHNQEKEVCKQCKKLFNSSIELLKHTAKMHHIEEVIDKEKYDQIKADEDIETEKDEGNDDSKCSVCGEELNSSNNTDKCTLCAILTYIPMGKE